jgi:uroporphyrinogen-III synthase
MAPPRTLILTRPRPQAEAFAAALEARLPGRFRPVIAPLMTIAPVAGPIELAGVAALVFTSANGVEQFAARTTERTLPAFCVGAMTAEAARRAGLAARSADGDVEALAGLIATALRPADGPLLHVRGRHAAGDLAGRLGAAGFETRAAEIYDQRPCPIDGEARALLAAGGADAVAVFSPRSAALFAGLAASAGWSLAAATAVALSAAAAAPLEGLGFGRRVTAAEPTRAGMIAVLAGA